MNKKVMAVAVAGALAVPASIALAQTSTVQIGGSITTFYYAHDPKNGTGAPATTLVSPTVVVGGVTVISTLVVPGASGGQKTDILETSEPEMYIRGEEKLGGGLSVWFQCTSSLDGMVGGGNANGICGRNSGIGFKGNWGNLFQGNWDTPQKMVFSQGRGWFGGTNSLTGGSARLLNTLGGGAPSGQNNSQSTASFFRRQANSWNYHSPSWNGFSVQGAFSASNEQVTLPEAAGLSPRLFSLAGQYSSGPLYVGAAYERHSDYNPLSQVAGAAWPVAGIPGTAVGTATGVNINIVTGVTVASVTGGCNAAFTAAAGAASCYSGGDDDNWTLVGGYKFGGFNIRGMYSKSEYELLQGLTLKNEGWGLFGDWAIQGPHVLRAQYVKADDVELTGAGLAAAGLAGGAAPSSGGKLWSMFYSYGFSKRTEGSVGYTKMKNDSLTDMWGLGKQAATLGGSQNSMGIVLKHRF